MGITDDTTSVPEDGDVCGHIRRRRVILVRSARAAGNPPPPHPAEIQGEEGAERSACRVPRTGAELGQHTA